MSIGGDFDGKEKGGGKRETHWARGGERMDIIKK